jgi:hypothetical protein
MGKGLKESVERPDVMVREYLDERETMSQTTAINAAEGSQDVELGSVLVHAQELVEAGDQTASADWTFAAAHVGDLSVLALAFCD